MSWLLIGAVVVVLWLACTWLGGWVASEKQRDPMLGYLLGFLFGIFGVFIVLLLPNGSHRPTVRREIPEEDEPEPDWQALGVKPSPPPKEPPPFTLPPPSFRGLRDE